MPDLTIEYHEMCSDLDRLVTHVSGYTQEFGFHYYPTCTCPAFKFSKSSNKTCKHIKEVEKTKCNWHGAYSYERQVTPGICPVCGKKTVIVRVGV